MSDMVTAAQPDAAALFRKLVSGSAGRVRRSPSAFADAAAWLRHLPLEVLTESTDDTADPRVRLTESGVGYFSTPEEDTAARYGPVYRRLLAAWRAVTHRFEQQDRRERFLDMGIEEAKRIVLLAAATFSRDPLPARLGLDWPWWEPAGGPALEGRAWASSSLSPGEHWAVRHDALLAAVEKLNEEGGRWWPRLDTAGRAAPPAEFQPLPRSDAKGAIYVRGPAGAEQSLRWAVESIRRFTAFVRLAGHAGDDGAIPLGGSQAVAAERLWSDMTLFACSVNAHFFPPLSVEQRRSLAANGLAFAHVSARDPGAPSDVMVALGRVISAWLPTQGEPRPRTTVPAEALDTLDRLAAYLDLVAPQFRARPAAGARGLTDVPPKDAGKGRSRRDPGQPTRPVSLGRAAKRWFKMDRRALADAVQSGLYAAAQLSERRWTFELSEVIAVNPDADEDADPTIYTRPKRRRAAGRPATEQ